MKTTSLVCAKNSYRFIASNDIMSEIEINKLDDKAEVIFEGEKLGDFDPQEL